MHRNMFQACNEEVTEWSMGSVIYVLQTRSLLGWRKNRIISNSNCALLTSCLAIFCYRSYSYSVALLAVRINRKVKLLILNMSKRSNKGWHIFRFDSFYLSSNVIYSEYLTFYTFFSFIFVNNMLFFFFMSLFELYSLK